MVSSGYLVPGNILWRTLGATFYIEADLTPSSMEIGANFHGW